MDSSNSINLMHQRHSNNNSITNSNLCLHLNQSQHLTLHINLNHSLHHISSTHRNNKYLRRHHHRNNNRYIRNSQGDNSRMLQHFLCNSKEAPCRWRICLPSNNNSHNTNNQ